MSSEEQLFDRIKGVSRNGKISCRAAHKVAGEFNVSVRKVGKMINKLNLKIVACQLGCF